MQHNELMDLVTKLSDRVVALETDLTQTKKVYGAAFTKLIKKVKRLEKKDKLSKSRRKLRLVLLDEEGVSTASIDFTTANVPVTTASAEISTASPEVKIAGVSVDDIAAESLVYIKNGVLNKRQNLKIKRISRAHKAASSFNIEEWEDIQARIEADEELAQSWSTKRAANERNWSTSSKSKVSIELSHEELQQLIIIVPKEGMNIEALQTKYPIIDWEVYTKDSRMYWKIIRVGNHTEVYHVFEDMLKTFNRDDLVKLWSLVQERFNSTEPTEDKEIEIWVELKRLFEPDADV
ncbi:hypothetical protein Tco_0474385 [Tanacetum coccineum]